MKAVHSGGVVVEDHPSRFFRVFFAHESQANGVRQDLAEGDLRRLGGKPGDLRRAMAAAADHDLGDMSHPDYIAVNFDDPLSSPGGRPAHVDPDVGEDMGHHAGMLHPGVAGMEAVSYTHLRA